jgi:membrane-bound ClpP family serine protease
MNSVDPLTWSIILLILGCGLACLEIFIPSGGLISFLAGLSLIGSITMAFRRDPATGFTFLLVTVLAVPTIVGLALKFWPRTPMGKAFLGELAQEGELVPEDWRRQLVGRQGVAQSKMLPSGAVQIEGEIIDAISHSGAIEKGQPVIIIEVRGNRVVVRPAEPGELSVTLAGAEGSHPAAPVESVDLLSKPIEELGLESLDDPLA